MIVIGAALIAKNDPQATMLVMPADHVIEPAEHRHAGDLLGPERGTGQARGDHGQPVVGLPAHLVDQVRHGLRVAELVDLRWDQIDFEPHCAEGRARQLRARSEAISCARCDVFCESKSGSRRLSSPANAMRPSTPAPSPND